MMILLKTADQALEVATGLEYLHSQNIVHGDLTGVRLSLLDIN